MRRTIWYHLYNLKTMKNTHGELLFLVKSQAKSLQLHEKWYCSMGVLQFFKLYKW